MPFLLPQLAAAGSEPDGRRPLPKRAERCAQLLADGTLTTKQVAKRAGVGERSVYRLKTHPAFVARLVHLRHLAAERALAEEPLALKGNRVVMAGRMARTLRDQLEKNDYTTTLGVSKQGNPIVGFDRARVAELRQYLQLIADELDPKRSTIADPLSQTVGVQATVTLDQAVVKVQALLSRVADAGDGQQPPGQAPGHPLAPGVGGGMSAAGSDTRESGGSVQGPQQILEAKGEVVE